MRGLLIDGRGAIGPNGPILIGDDGAPCCCGPQQGGECCDSVTRQRYCPDSPNGEVLVCCTCGDEYDFQLDHHYFVQDGPLPGAWGNPDSHQSFPCTFGQAGVPPPPPSDILYSVDFHAMIRFSVRCVNGIRTVTQTGPALYHRVEKHWAGYPFWPGVTPHYVTTTTELTTFRDVYVALFGDLRRAPCGLGFDYFTVPALTDYGQIQPLPGQIPAPGDGGYPWSDCDGTATLDSVAINPCSGPSLHAVGGFGWGGAVGCLGGNVSFNGTTTTRLVESFGDGAAIETRTVDGSAVWSVTNVVPCAHSPCDAPRPAGACCAAVADPLFPFNCTIRTESDCVNRGGTYHGDGSVCKDAHCPKIGACCGSNNLCTQTTGAFCFTSGGTYQGDGTACAPDLCGAVGGCCIPLITGTVCEIHNQPGCLARGGVYLGDGTNCLGDPCAPDTTPRGACCIDGGAYGCFENVTFDGCVAIANSIPPGSHGIVWSLNDTCANIGCFPPGPGVVRFA